MASNKEKKGETEIEKLPIIISDESVREKEEFSRLMNTYSEMADRWTLPALHLPMFPYWRDVDIRYPAVDIADYGDRFQVTAEVPGFDKEDIELRMNGFSLEIKAEKNLDGTGSKSRNYVQRERLHSSYYRVVQFPQEVSPSRVSAVLKNGLLEVEVSKVSEKSKRVEIH